jgi:hypothetical protein
MSTTVAKFTFAFILDGFLSQVFREITIRVKKKKENMELSLP